MCTASTLEELTRAAPIRQAMLPDIWQIQSARNETRDVFTLTLTPRPGSDPFHFAPGQFNMLYVFGMGEVPISISGDPARPETLVHTIRTVGTVTRAMAELRRGQALGVRGPYGTDWPVERARGRDVVLAAGGIGLAPLRPALYHILAHREEYGRIVLLYGARTPRDILYPRELEKWRGRFDLDVGITVDATAGAWRGDVGVVTTLIPNAQFDPGDTVAMICGPEIMMRFTALQLVQLGVSEEDIFISMERNMQCGLGYCGHCQFGPTFICKDGPVFRYDRLAPWLEKREV